jgi:sensor histidine kinase YesM
MPGLTAVIGWKEPVRYLSNMPESSATDDFILFLSGMFFLAIFYWLVSFLYTKNRNYLILILVTLSTVLLNLNTLGVLIHVEKAELVILGFVIFAYGWFASEFAAMKDNLSRVGYLSFVIGLGSMIAFQVLSPLFLKWQTAFTVSFLLMIVGILYGSVFLLYLWIAKGNSSARLGYCAFIPKGSASILLSLAQIGVLPIGWTVATAFASFTYMLFLIYGTVINVVFIRAERERERREKEDLIQHQNILLKQKVEERTRELEAERKRSEELLIKASQRQMAELELHSLRAQLNPHFMFNSLNAIQELILKEDFDNAHTYLARFAKLVRIMLENAERPFTPLQKEIDFLELYLSLEKLRIPDLAFSIVTDPDIDKEETLIPNMILQPYIENALWHGLSHKAGDKKLALTIEKNEGGVVYLVKDNGVGRKRSAELKSLYRQEHKSKGMELLTKRFKLLRDEFGSDIETNVNDLMNKGEVAGTEVSIIVPDSLTKNRAAMDVLAVELAEGRNVR